MNLKNATVAIDYETNGLEYWLSSFKVISLAASWREGGQLKNFYSTCLTEIISFVESLLKNECEIIVHNAQFESGVSIYHLGISNFVYTWDTMRLMQVYDNGGHKKFYDNKFNTLEDILEDENEEKLGISLGSMITRLLPTEYHGHKEKYYDILREKHNIRSKFGAYIHLLDDEDLRRYNLDDTDLTLMCFEELMTRFREEKYNPKFDHSLYGITLNQVVGRTARGVGISDFLARNNLINIRQQVADIEAEFFKELGSVYDEFRSWKKDKLVSKYKSTKFREALLERCRKYPHLTSINYNSTAEVRKLFFDLLGYKSKFMTSGGKNGDNPQPSTKSAHLKTYGKHGKILSQRNKRLLVYRQLLNLYRLSKADGKWHPDVRVCGTKTGRMASGEGE